MRRGCKEQFTAEEVIRTPVVDRSKALPVIGGGAAMLGYERSNQGEKLLPDGAAAQWGMSSSTADRDTGSRYISRLDRTRSVIYASEVL